MHIIVYLTFVFSLHSTSKCQLLCEKGMRHKNCRLLPKDNQCGVVKPTPRIIGGYDATLGQFPYMALLHNLGGNSSDEIYLDETCGGAVINDRYVISAAHCFGDRELNAVRVGEHKLSTSVDCSKSGDCAPPHQDLEIEDVVFPEDSDKKTKHDIALVRLKRKVKFNEYVSPICLPTVKQFLKEDYVANTSFNVAGWGLVSGSKGIGFKDPDVLQTVMVPLMRWQDCARVWQSRQPLAEDSLCAGGVKGKDSCNGDSGGPLVGEFDPTNTTGGRRFLIGVVSYGTLCGREGWPGVYTNVAAFAAWILDNIRR